MLLPLKLYWYMTSDADPWESEVMLLLLKLYWYMTSDADPWESMRLCCFC